MKDAKRSRLDASLGVVNTLLAVVAAVTIIFMMFAICYSVISRFLWNKPVPWVVEVSSYMMLYITFLGMAWLQRQEGHVRIDLFLSRMSPRAIAGLDFFTSLGGAAVGVILAWKGTSVTVDYFQRDVTVIGILNTPQYLLMGIIPIGGALLFLEFLLRTWRSFRVTCLGVSPEKAGVDKPSSV